jgi:hypothetical protein
MTGHVRRVSCLAHARRKFDAAPKAVQTTGLGGPAAEAYVLIQRIHRFKKVAREAASGPSSATDCATRNRGRRGLSCEVDLTECDGTRGIDGERLGPQRPRQPSGVA